MDDHAGSASLSILLIEDERVDALMVRSSVRQMDASVQFLHVDTLAKGRQALESGDFDLVLTDLTLPDAKGLEAVLALKEWSLGLPVIVLTGLDDEARGLEALHSGADDYLVKSEVRGRALARAIRYAVDKTKIREHLLDARHAHFVERLAGGVAHEFNNLLTQIRVRADGMLETSQPGDVLHSELSGISEAVTKGANLTRQLLNLGRRNLNRSVGVDLNKVLLGVESTLRSLAQPSLKFQLKLSDGKLPLVGDRLQIEELLIALVWAAKAVAPQGGEAVLEASLSSEESFSVMNLVVTGEALSAEKAASLMSLESNFSSFDDFFLSIGLPSARQYVERMGGSFLLSSLADKIEWRVTFPVASNVENHRGSVARDKMSTLARVLIVEDDQVIRTLNQRVLQKRGFQTVAVANFEEAMAVWKEEQNFDLLLTDIHLGYGPDGLELARQLLRDNPDLKCLYCSGYCDSFEADDHGLQNGVNFLSKPYSLGDLVERVTEILS